MFESLSDKLSSAFKSLKSKGKLGEKDLDAAMREVRLALLEADVHYKVVKDFVAKTKERSRGQEIMKSLTPGQMVVKIVKEELLAVVGDAHVPLNFRVAPPAPLLLLGLQGAGKTTTAGKLALYLRRDLKRRPYLVPCDIYRPAAIAQLKKIAREIDVPVYGSDPGQKPVDICRAARDEALRQGCDSMIVDTAGRLHIDEALMDELREIDEVLQPKEKLLVADAMTGQDAVNVAREFNSALDITGVILTKMEGDARGGAALSIKAVVDRPIKFVGVGEKLDALEPFHPERMVSRILGMGDVLSLIEKAEKAIDEETALDLEEKLRKNNFTLEDFRDQIKMLKKLGSMKDLMKMMPGMGNLKNVNPDESELVRVVAIIDSMTPKERKNPGLLNASRRKRIAAGSGTKVEDVNRLMNRFKEARTLMKRMGISGPRKGKKNKRGKFKKSLRPKFPVFR